MKIKVFSTRIVFLYFVIFVLTAAGAYAATLSVGQAQGPAGTQGVVIPITLLSASGENISSLNLDLNFDRSKLSFRQVTIGAAGQAAGKSLSYSTPAFGRVRIVVAGINKNVITSGVVANFAFDVLSGASSGDALLTITSAVASAPDAARIGLSVINGRIIVGAENKEAGVGISPNQSAPSTPPEQPKESNQIVSPGVVILPQSQGSNVPVGAVANVNPYNKEVPIAEKTANVYPSEEPVRHAETGEEIAVSTAPASHRVPVPSPKPSAKPAALAIKEGPVIEKPPASKAMAKETGRFLLWRTYQLQAETESPPKYWELAGSEKLPYILRLDADKGTIRGIVWGRGVYKINLEVTMSNKEKIKVPCSLVIR